MSDYFRQNVTISAFSGGESWVILSEIEQRIKAKIEAVGTPLKDWDINIYRGVLTGYNEAFIISKEKKEEILANCQNEEEREKTIELIRPILRGRDIKRYSYEFADLYLIATFPSLKIEIDEYPAVKQHLLSFGYDRLKQTGDKGARKKTNNKWFETQDTIAYWEDFSKQKIVYPDISQKLSFCLCTEYILLGNTVYFITAKKNDDLHILLKYLNSDLINWYYKSLSVQLGQDAVRMFSIYVLNIPIPKKINGDVYKSYGLNDEEVNYIKTISHSS